MPHWLKYTILALIFLLLASWPLARQLETAAIEGQITNQSGALAGASVEARNVITGVVARTISGRDGLYRLDGLKPGRYTLWVTADGHCSVLVERVAAERGETVRRDIRLNRTGGSGGSSLSTESCAPASISSAE